ncbi:MAG TPA: HAMP domain-containing sensor histidine kinase [Longimicrobiales bacterium]|nr:HAMP domain-containing sensor histidine kinase [Longimicrobiales bacterium]
MGEVATIVGLPSVIAAIARAPSEDFDIRKNLQHLAEAAQTISGARGVAIENAENGAPREALVVVGMISGTPRRVPIILEGQEIGFLAVYGTAMFGPATADRTQAVADLTALALARRPAHGTPTVDDSGYRLITGVGLNLRNTLGAALGYLQLVEMEGALNVPQQEYASRGRRAIGSAVSLISDLLELTRADAGKLTFDREPVNLYAIAREAVRKHTATAAAKRCTIDVASQVKNPVVFTDSSHIQQILDVLIYNAARYTREDTSINVTIEPRDGRRATDPARWICVCVTDHGTGVPDADKVFEEVHRVEQMKGNVRFKLAICRRVARLLGGDLTVDSEKDVSSTFTLWVPAPTG